MTELKMETLRDLAVQFAKKKTMVDDLTNDAPILDKILWSEATDAFSNTVGKLDSVTGASFVDINGTLSSASATEKLVKVDLEKMGAKLEVQDDTARAYGGAAAYFAKFEPKILRKTGANVEAEIVQTHMLNYALNNSKALKTAAASGNGYSLYAIRFIEDETCGIYGKGMPFAKGDLLERLPVNGGNLYFNASGQEVYGTIYKGFFGFQIANDNSVGAICNIQSDKLPTAAQIEDLLNMVRADNSKTFLFCAPKCLTYLSSLKTSYLKTEMSDTNMKVGITHWNGVPIITSYNIAQETFHSIA